MERDLTGIKKIFGKYEDGFKKQENKEPYDKENIFDFMLYSLMLMVLENQQHTKGLEYQIAELDIQFQNLSRKYNQLLSTLNNKEDKKVIGD